MLIVSMIYERWVQQALHLSEPRIRCPRMPRVAEACIRVAFAYGNDIIASRNGDLIIAKFSPKGYEEISRAHLLEPTTGAANGRDVLWSHPAFANRHFYGRNDKEIICVDLAVKH